MDPNINPATITTGYPIPAPPPPPPPPAQRHVVPRYPSSRPVTSTQEPTNPFGVNLRHVVPAPPPPPPTPVKKVLVVLSSSAGILHLRGGKTQRTGVFLSELTRPLQAMVKAGFQPIFGSPLGDAAHVRPPPIDPLSDNFIWFGTKSEYDEAKELIDQLSQSNFEGSFSRPRRLSSFSETELAHSFQGIFIPGGHAPMIDLYKDSELGRILWHFHRHNKPTGAICHGPAALFSAGITNLDDRIEGKPAFSIRVDWPYAGYHLTCYSDREEKVNELLWRDKVPFLLETALKKAGAIVDVRSIPMMPNVVTYRELITGQGPTSATQFGKAFTDALIRYSQSYPYAATASTYGTTASTVSATSTSTSTSSGVPAPTYPYSQMDTGYPKPAAATGEVGGMATQVVSRDKR